MGGAGKDITFPQLAQMLTALQGQGAHNINLVTGTHYAPYLVEAMRTARKAGLRIPVIWNSGGYETDQTLALLQDTVDVYLPDLKYFSRDTALRYSRAGDYVETAKAAIRQMFRQAGACVFDGDGMIVRGVIVRHLVLPGRIREAKEIIRYLHGEYGNEIYLSIMNQYTPVLPPGEYPELERKISKREYEDVLEFALKIGVENAYVQEGGTAKESFIPPFHEDLF